MIASTSNPQIKYIRSLQTDRRERRRERLFVLEGVRLLADALAHGAEITLAIFSPEQLGATDAGLTLLQWLEQQPFAYPATPQALAAAADTVHPQGVIALARWKDAEPGQPGLLLVLDSIQDPGNLGALLRSAEAVGVAQVLCGPGTADLYSPKVVRAAMGAHFRLAMEQDLSWDALGEQLAFVDHIYAADAQARMPYYAADWRQPSALIIGNEAHGLSEPARELATKLISIPMRGQAESLNAAIAGSVVLFEALRQRTRGKN